MDKDPNDLWPDIDDEEMTTPLTILKEQGSFLAKKTKGLLEIEIVTSSESSKFYHNFNIVVSVLDYTYRLFRVSHDVMLYPLDVFWLNKYYKVDDEKAFREFLGRILSDDSTRTIVLALLAQAKS